MNNQQISQHNEQQSNFCALTLSFLFYFSKWFLLENSKIVFFFNFCFCCRSGNVYTKCVINLIWLFQFELLHHWRAVFSYQNLSHFLFERLTKINDYFFIFFSVFAVTAEVADELGVRVANRRPQGANVRLFSVSARLLQQCKEVIRPTFFRLLLMLTDLAQLPTVAPDSRIANWKNDSLRVREQGIRGFGDFFLFKHALQFGRDGRSSSGSRLRWRKAQRFVFRFEISQTTISQTSENLFFNLSKFALIFIFMYFLAWELQSSITKFKIVSDF